MDKHHGRPERGGRSASRRISNAGGMSAPIVEATAQLVARRPLPFVAPSGPSLGATIESDRRQTGNGCGDAFVLSGVTDPSGYRNRIIEPEILFRGWPQRAPRPLGAVERATSTAGRRQPFAFISLTIVSARWAAAASAFAVGIFLVPMLLWTSPAPNAATTGWTEIGAAETTPFAIRDLVATVATRGESDTLIIAGRVVNETGRADPVPPMRIVLSDSSGARFSRVVRIGTATLAPGEAIRFKSAVVVPSGAGEDLSVGFVTPPTARS